MSIKHFLVSVAVAASLAGGCGAVFATTNAAEERTQYDVAAQPLGDALQELGRQSGLTVMVASELVRGRMAPAVKGEYTAEEALGRLLEASGLHAEYLDPHTVAVRASPVAKGGEIADIRLARAESHSPSDSSQSAAPPVASSASGVEEEATVTEGIPEVLVRGSMILNMDVKRTKDDPQPYYILDSQQISRSGATNVQDFIKQHLSMDTTAVTGGNRTSYYAGGVSSFNLRGLGSNATLILIDGRRTAGVPDASGGSPLQADINGIPLSAIERIEVLPSSAAAIYGGAALGGVINVVLKHGYRGADLSARYDNTMDTDASIRTIDGSYGFSLEQDKTHVLLGAHYVDSGSLLNGDRPELMQRGISRVLQNGPSAIASATLPFATGATPNIASTDGSNLVLKPEFGGAALNAPNTFVSPGISPTTSGTDLGAALLANAGQYNYQLPDSVDPTGLGVTVMPAIEQTSFFGSVRREMTSKLEVFVDYFTSRSTSESRFTPVSATRTIPASSPVNPFAQSVRVSFPTPELTTYGSETKSERADAGAILRLPLGWTAEADYTWNRSSLEYGTGFGANAPLNAAFASGALNPFVDTLASPLALDSYMGRFGFSAPSNVLRDINLRAGGRVGQLPGGAPFLTIGIGHREEKLGDSHFFHDYPGFPLSNISTLYLSQKQKTDSLYAEVLVPLVSGENDRPGLRKLELQLAGRTEKYSVSSRSNTINLLNPGPIPEAVTHDYTSTNPTIGLSYKPVQSLTMRTSYGTAFLPPSYTQLLPAILFPNSFVPTVNDPRRGGSRYTVPNYIRGGNADLVPQEARTFNVGAVWEPAFAQGLRVDFEYYQIVQDRVIVSPPFLQAGFQQVVNNESVLPEFVTRDAPAPGDPYEVGPINTIALIPVNGAKGTTDGFDLDVSYRHQTEHSGTWSFSALGTLIESYRIAYAGAAEQELVNQVNNNGPLRLRLNTTLQWERGPWNLGWRANFLDSYPQLQAYVAAQGSSRVPSQTYHTLFAQYSVASQNSTLDGLTLQVGIKNVFNHVPPFDAAYNPYYYSPFGDPRLRSYWLSINKHF